MSKLLPYVFLMLPLFLCSTAYAQNSRIDAALDRYEVICDKCILLRDRASRGEEISSQELKDLLEQVSKLRNTIQKGSGNMSPAQKNRFDRIRRRYTVAFSGNDGRTDEPVLKVARPVMEVPKMSWTPPVRAITAGPALRPFGRLTTAQAQGPEKVGEPVEPPALRSFGRLTTAQAHGPEKQRPEIGILALGAWQPSAVSYGGMVTITMERFGIYLKGWSNFTETRADYSCQSDGTSGGKVIWTSGKESHSSWIAGAGGIFRIAGPLSLYAGSGYGHSLVFWEDSAGKWALVEDYSVKGICADAGLLFTTGRFTASAGAGTTGIKKTALEIGIGILF